MSWALLHFWYPDIGLDTAITSTVDADHRDDFPGQDFSSVRVIQSSARGIRSMRKTSPLGLLLSLGYAFQKSNSPAIFRSKCFLIWKGQLQDLSYWKKQKRVLIIKLFLKPWYIHFFSFQFIPMCFANWNSLTFILNSRGHWIQFCRVRHQSLESHWSFLSLKNRLWMN